MVNERLSEKETRTETAERRGGLLPVRMKDMEAADAEMEEGTQVAAKRGGISKRLVLSFGAQLHL